MSKVCPFFCLKIFLELFRYFFSETLHDIKNPCGVVHDSLIFLFFDDSFTPKMGKMGQQNEPDRVFWMYRKIQLLIFWWILSIMKVYINCCILEQISYFAKIWFLRHRPECSRPIILLDFQFNYISRIDWWKKPDFLQVVHIHGN